jgi:hypothetical protein
MPIVGISTRWPAAHPTLEVLNRNVEGRGRTRPWIIPGLNGQALFDLEHETALCADRHGK